MNALILFRHAFSKLAFKQIPTVILEQEVPMCKLLILHNRKSINQLICIKNLNKKRTMSLIAGKQS